MRIPRCNSDSGMGTPFGLGRCLLSGVFRSLGALRKRGRLGSPVCLSVCLSLCLSLCLYVCLSVSLSLCVCVFVPGWVASEPPWRNPWPTDGLAVVVSYSIKFKTWPRQRLNFELLIWMPGLDQNGAEAQFC